jgi:hypothetical protein
MALDHVIGPMVHICDSQIEERGAAELRLSDLGAMADYFQDAESYQHLSISEGHTKVVGPYATLVQTWNYVHSAAA